MASLETANLLHGAVNFCGISLFGKFLRKEKDWNIEVCESFFSELNGSWKQKGRKPRDWTAERSRWVTSSGSGRGKVESLDPKSLVKMETEGRSSYVS